MTGIAVRRPGNDDADDDEDNDEVNDAVDDVADGDGIGDDKNHLEHNNLFRFICEKPGATIEAWKDD